MAKTLTVFLAADLKKFNSGMDQAQRKTQGFSGTLRDKMGPALIAAGAAAGAFALKLAKDGVQAAIEDEKAVASLTNTLNNLNLAHDNQAVEDYIYSLERAYGVADTDLRPAYERLVRSTNDTEEANRALKVAMDVSAATGQSLSRVSDILGRAYDGQTSSLSRLGVGMDKTTLATASMDEILNTLSTNFSGAADAAANTFEGRMQRLKTATDNLAEAFGAGLLESLNDATSGTQDAVDAMEDLEPLLRDVGGAAGDTVEDIAYLAGLLGDLAGALEGVEDAAGPIPAAFDAMRRGLEPFLNPLGFAVDTIKALRGELDQLGGSGSSAGERLSNDLKDLGNEAGNAADEIKEVGNVAYNYRPDTNSYYDLAAAYTKQANDAKRAAEELANQARGTTGAATATETLTKKQQALLEQYEEMSPAFQETTTDLIDQIQVVKDATAAVEDYANTIQQDLLSGINLGDLYGAQFDEEGNRTGTSLIEGFNAAIDQAEWFGNVLNAIKAQNADKRLIEEIAGLGPEVGGALGQQLLDEGLVPTMNEKWVGVQETTKNLALGLVPEYLEAGRLSAIANLDAMAEQFGKDQRRFKKLGKQLGRQVGAEFKKQIAKDVRDAVRAVEAAATSARAEAVAKAEAQQARLTEQSVALAVASVIRNSDQRAGRNVEPVLQ